MSVWKKTIVAAALALAGAAAGAAPILSFSTPASSAPGAGADVQVRIADVADLYTYQLSVVFDPHLLQVAGVSTGGFLGSAGNTFSDPGVVDNGAGTISFAFDTLLGPEAGASGSGALLDIHFDTLGTGSAALNFADLLFLDSTGSDIGVVATGGVLAIADAAPGGNVPEPASALLFGLGGIVLAARRRRVA